MYLEEIIKQVIGKSIVKYSLESDGSKLTLDLDSGESIVLVPEGDCCSQAWIESMDAPDALLGVIQGIEDIDMPSLGNNGTKIHPDVDQVSYYGLKVTTNKGRCVIDYRNDSNGYYGGWLNAILSEVTPA